MNIDHLSYSTAKKIYRKGIDYALGTKLGLIEESFGEAPPQASLTKEQLQALAQDCDKNINVYTFTIKTDVTTTTVGK